VGKRSRDKGARREREFVELHRAAGIPCERVPLSGAAGGSFGGDLVIGSKYTAEVKARAHGQGWATIARWMGKQRVLLLRADRCPPLAVLEWELYLEAMRALCERPDA